MIDLDLVGISEADLQQRLAIDPLNVPDGPEGSQAWMIGKLIHRIRSRIQEGMTRNFQDYRLFFCLDKAWDQPFQQLSPTLLASFIDQDPNDEKVYKAFQEWGMTNLITEENDPKTGKPVKKFNLPVFFNIFVPLVRSYVTIRWAKIINDRRLNPFFKFEPIKLTTPLTLKCETLTDRIQVMSNQYGYFDVLKQAVLKMLHYSVCFQFPKTEWHYEEQLKTADQTDVDLNRKKKDSEDPASVGDTIRETVREGIPYHLPHPTRTFHDLAHPAFTLNYDYGCEYAGYWRIARYREIQGSTFWNKDKIALGTVDLVSGNRLFFTTVYSACTLTIPTRAPVQPKAPDGPVLGAELGLGAGNLDREKEIATLYYGTEHGDQGVLVTEYFERLIPKDNGLGDYDCPVWFRFVVAGDGCTILYAAPLPYAPVIYYGYDADESRVKNASLSLEVLPFQDHFSNMLTQILLTCKQNLANMVFVDEDQLQTSDSNSPAGKTVLDKIKNIGEGIYRFLNVFSFSSKKAHRLLSGQQSKVVESFSFPRGNIAEMTNVLRELLDILERVLVMSSQEVAQAASHELRVDEVRNIAQSTSSRLVFTATPVDIAREAWKRQLYQGLMAYGDDDIWVHIPADIPMTPEALNLMGFVIHDKPVIMAAAGQGPGLGFSPRDKFYRARIKKSKIAMALWEFASTRDGEDRGDNSKVAQTMSLMVQNLLSNPMTAAAIGPAQAIELANQIARLAGLPKDFKLRDNSQESAAMQQQSREPIPKLIETMNYKDLPPDVQRELEAKAGLTPSKVGGSSPMEAHAANIAGKATAPPQPPEANGQPGNGAPAGAPAMPPEQTQAQDQLKQVIQIVLGQVHQEMKQELEPLLAATSQLSQKVAAIEQSIGQSLNPSNDRFAQPPAPPGS